MRVAFVADAANADGTLGGAELTMRELAAAAPRESEIVTLDEAQTIVVGNCASFGPELTEELAGKRIIRYHNDLARREDPALRVWLESRATHIFTSPLHQRLYNLDGVWPNIPPPIDLEAFRPPQGRKRAGAVAVGSWQNPGKGQQLLREWSDSVEPIDVYGPGPFAPTGPNLHHKGVLAPEQVREALWGYETFVHLPTAPEPFGRAVVEASAAGLTLVVNEQVGALYYLREAPEKLASAAEDFWELVCAPSLLGSGRGK